MKKRLKILAICAVTLVSAHASAVIQIQRGFTRDLFIGPTTLLVTPDQALTYVTTGSVGSVVNETLNCLIPVASCTGGPGIAMRSDDLSIAGINATGSGSAGADAATSVVNLTGAGATPSGIHTMDVLSGDFQKIRFDVAGAGVPEFIDVDITFSVSATIEDRTLVPIEALYFPFASGGVEVLEAATYTPGAPPSIFAAFSALAQTSSGSESLTGATETFSARPNVDYWVRIITQANVTLSSGDFSGLDVDITGYADPTFALNSAFADANPDVAEGFSISRLATVPLPPSIAMLVTAIGLIAGTRRKS